MTAKMPHTGTAREPTKAVAVVRLAGAGACGCAVSRRIEAIQGRNADTGEAGTPPARDDDEATEGMASARTDEGRSRGRTDRSRSLQVKHAECQG